MTPVISLTLARPSLNHVPKCHVYTPLKYLQGWGLNYIPGYPFPVLDNPFHEAGPSNSLTPEQRLKTDRRI